MKANTIDFASRPLAGAFRLNTETLPLSDAPPLHAFVPLPGFRSLCSFRNILALEIWAMALVDFDGRSGIVLAAVHGSWVCNPTIRRQHNLGTQITLKPRGYLVTRLTDSQSACK